jgi:hypothetical protein
LARIGVTAVAAVDQVGAGGNLDPNTKITIEKITLTGYFGNTGVLNLDNEKANVANWRFISGVDLTAHTGDDEVSDLGLTKTTLTLAADHTSGTESANHKLGTIARHLQFVGTPATNQYDPSNTPVEQISRVGVTTVRQNVIMPALIDNAPGAGHNRPWHTEKEYASGELKYSETTPYYTNANCTALASATITKQTAVTISSDGKYTLLNADATLTYPNELKYYDANRWVPITTENATKYASYDAYDTDYKPTGSAPVVGNKVLERGLGLVSINATNKSYYEGKGYQGYTWNSTTLVATPKAVGEGLEVGNVVIVGKLEKSAPAFTWDGGSKKTFYKRDNNYFMVVPINNIPNICTSLTDAEKEKLRTVTVQIEYYITTEDSKLANGRAQTKNVITKDVVFPSIANGKSYNLNLVLGLTSVKMEAEVDDWKVINVQGDLPQNTATE